MTAPAPTHRAPVALPSRVGQGTVVEQSRAVAEVQAAVIVAKQEPRDIGAARDAMLQSCSMHALANSAFYRFPRGKETVTGSTIALARELARCWGNIDSGIKELRRDDEHGQSEMMAFAWDMQANSRTSSTFIVPHRRSKNGPDGKPTNVPLVDDRDVYENNTNNAARRLRECIFALLPPWFIEEAENACRATIAKGDGRPFEERRAAAVESFARLGVTVDQLERKVGRPLDRWTPYDLPQLVVAHRSISRGEIAVDDEFPPLRVTAAEVLAVPAAPAAAADDVTPEQRAAEAARLAELEAKAAAAADDGGWITDDEIAAQQADPSAPAATAPPENPEGAGPDSPTPSTTRRKAP